MKTKPEQDKSIANLITEKAVNELRWLQTKYSNTEIAGKLGISTTKLYRWLSGKTKINLAKLDNLIISESYAGNDPEEEQEAINDFLDRKAKARKLTAISKHLGVKLITVMRWQKRKHMIMDKSIYRKLLKLAKEK